ncbi:hypothetical protein EPN27_03255 [Patescibacteria group bacterium]|nr:MAG: hypothetical protein EPN27_03255 [Patescibacteria group bacterium]
MNKINSLWIIIVSFILIALLLYLLQKIKNNESSAVAQVGGIIITNKDVAYKLATERVYGNKTIVKSDVTGILLGEATEHEVASALDVLPNEADITSFSERVDKTTKAPELLQAVKSVFGEDTASYKRLYLLPKMVNIALHSAYAADKNAHSESFAKIDKARKEAIAGGTLEQVARLNGLEYINGDIKKSETIDPILQEYFTENDIQEPKLFFVLNTLKNEEIYIEVVDNENSYQVIRLLSNENDVYKVEMIVSKKLSYEEWYGTIAEKINLTKY